MFGRVAMSQERTKSLFCALMPVILFLGLTMIAGMLSKRMRVKGPVVKSRRSSQRMRASSFDCLLWLISCSVLETGKHGAAPGVFKQELLKEEL